MYPCIGSVVSLKKGYEGGYKGSLPPYISLTNALGRFSEAGFLGSNYKTFATGGDPNAKEVRVQGLVAPAGINDKRQQQRRSLLESVDSLAKEMEKQPEIQTMDSYQEKAYGLILGDAKKAFDMSQEKDETRERYGRNHFGQCCLLARRLVEHGVPFITVNSGGWDTHTDNFGAMKRLLPNLDHGFSALLEDLSQRGLLESTIVVWYGEFGRTPKVYWEPPWNGGRHHFGRVFSCVVVSADGAKAASGSADGTVKLWATADNRPLATLVQLAPGKDDWLVLSGLGYFDASTPGALEWKAAYRTTASEKLAEQLAKPESVRDVIAGKKVAPPALK